MKKIWPAGLGLVTLFAALNASAISPAILLTIDDSNPSAVTFTATTDLPLRSSSGITVASGVDLLGFFSADELNMTYDNNLPLGNLVGGNSGVPYATTISDNFSTGGTGAYFDLELYDDVGSVKEGSQSTAPEDFSLSQPGFIGSWTVDLMSLGVDPSALPVSGTQGSILVGYSGNSDVVIGSWQVPPTATPEPSTEGLMAMGALAIGTLLYRRKN